MEPPPRPLSPERFESFFQGEPGAYPGCRGHTTYPLAPAPEQPATVVGAARGPADARTRLDAAQAAQFAREGFVTVEGLIGEGPSHRRLNH